MAGFSVDDMKPKVEGVGLVMFQGHNMDLNSVGKRVGSYQAGMGCATHEVFDVPASAFHEFIRERIPTSVASNADASIFRLYVPMKDRGNIGTIALLNGVYKAPAHPWVSTNGRTPMYCAPDDQDKYKARCEPTRVPRQPKPAHDTTWRPGPGDRFRVWEVDTYVR